MSFVTILTPAYNRAYVLPKLYVSLTEQTDHDFEWLVVDDGSLDDTEALIKGYIAEDKIRITYIKKKNGGKHDALNVGIQQITSEWTMIVDSDDRLTPNAVSEIRKYANRVPMYQSKRIIAGISFLRAYPDGQTNGKKPEQNEIISDFIENRINSRDELADKAEVYLTEILKKYPFPVYGNEKFLQENIVWINIAFEYDMVFLNEAIYIGDYLEDGLTRNVMKNKLNNPIGMYQNAALLMNRRFTAINQIKGALLFNIYYKLAHGSMWSAIAKSPNKWVSFMGLVPSYAIYLYYIVRYKDLIHQKRES